MKEERKKRRRKKGKKGERVLRRGGREGGPASTSPATASPSPPSAAPSPPSRTTPRSSSSTPSPLAATSSSSTPPASSSPPPSPPSSPRLLLPYVPSSSSRKFFDLSYSPHYSQIFTFDTHEPRDKIVCGSSFGFLSLLDPDCALSLWNPFTRSLIPFPRPNSLPSYLGFHIPCFTGPEFARRPSEIPSPEVRAPTTLLEDYSSAPQRLLLWPRDRGGRGEGGSGLGFHS